MTNDEALAFGWVYGYLTSAGAKTSIPLDAACARPYTASGAIVSDASFKHLLTPDREKSLSEAFSRIACTDEPESRSGEEKKQPLSVQGSWQLGYYKGLGGDPLPPAEKPFDIAARRKAKGLTQAQLAEQIGALQSHVSRWESGAVTPGPSTLKRLHEILD